MPEKAARFLALIGLASDQAIGAGLRRFAPELVHSNPYFPFLQNWLGWLAVAAALAVLASPARERPELRPGLYLVSAGFCSNLLSKLWYGGFTDYLPTGISYINLADVLVGLGCLLLVRRLVRSL